MKIMPFVNVKTCLIIQSRLKPATFVSEVSSLTQWANEALPWHNWLKLLVYNTFHIFDCEGLVPFRGVFGDTKEIIRIRNSKKDRQHNVQKRKDRQHNDQKKDRQHNVQKKKNRQHNVQKKKDRQHNVQKKDRQYSVQKKKDRQHNVQKKDRQYNVQKKKDRQYNVQKKKDRHYNVQKKDRQHNVQKKKDKPSCYYVYWPGDMSWMRIGPSCAYFLYSYHRTSNLRV